MEEKKSEDIIEIEDTRPEYMKKRVLVPSITAIIFLICGMFYGVHTVYYKSTDDAFIEGHVITIAPRVSGPVLNLNIEDNQEVKKGDFLLEIDPKDYEAKLKETRAKLDEAKAALVNTENQVAKNLSDLEFAESDFERYSKMRAKGISSKQDYEASLNKLTSARANSNSAKAKYNEISASIKRLEAEVEQDELNLSYTKIYAASDGRITNRTVEQGNYVQVAQPMFAIVPEKMWVVANFKETTLVARHSQMHQVYLVDNLSNFNLVFQQKFSALLGTFMANASSSFATVKTNAYFYKSLLSQSRLMAYVDVFAIFALIAFILMPLALLFRVEPKRVKSS